MTQGMRKRASSASFTLALLIAACGGDESVASKSAAAYRDAQARGVPVAGGHDHGGHAAPSTATGTVDHSAHGTTADAHAGMDHGATVAAGHEGHAAAAPGGGPVDHAAMGHATAPSADHSQHGAGSPAKASAGGHDRHAGMQPATASVADHSQHTGRSTTSNAHGQHGEVTGSASVAHSQHGEAQTPTGAHAQHGASRQRPTGHEAHPTDSTASQHAGMQHGTAQPAVATARGAGHVQTATQQPPPDPHAGHAPSSPAVRVPNIQPPVSSSAIRQVNPAATLKQDAFDAAAPLSVSEAHKAAQGGDHAMHGTRSITPGEDRASPPSPMPERRDRTTTPDAHDRHGVTAPPPAPGRSEVRRAPSAPAATVYSCPMHPEVTSSRPGSCPKCGMALVKKN